MRALLTLALLATTVGACAAPRLRPAEAARLVGRTDVIVGASSGFGRGLTVRLGREHARLVLAARGADLLDEGAAEVRAGGGEALVVPTGASDPAQVEALGGAAVAQFGRIDAGVNDAAGGAFGRFWEAPLADHEQVAREPGRVLAGSHVALRQLIGQGYGTLVNMGSVEGAVPLANHSSYGRPRRRC